MIIEFLVNFFTTAGIIWTFLIILRSIAQRNNKTEKLEVNGVQMDKETVMYAVAEYIEEGSFKGYLIFEKDNNNFMAQGQTKDECREELRKRFPGKTILLTGWNES